MTPSTHHQSEARLERARQLYALGRFIEALPLLTALVDEHPNYADLWHMLGIAEHHNGQLGRAERAFRRALQINTDYTEAALSLTILLNDTGRYEAARELYRSTLRHSSDGAHPIDPLAAGKIANMHADLARAYDAAHQPDQARAEFQRALALCPQFIDIRMALANLLFEQRKVDEAISELRQCVADKPDFVPAWLRLAAVLMHQKHRDEAKEIYDTLLAQDPHLAEAQRGLRLTVSSVAPKSEA